MTGLPDLEAKSHSLIGEDEDSGLWVEHIADFVLHTKVER